MEEVTYLFIDGGYVRCAFRDTINALFGSQYAFDFARLKDIVRARRAFYYDCVDNLMKQGESQTIFDARVQSQEEFLDSIRSLEGFHVREGFLSPGRLKQQKEVDVILAVEMMSHSSNRNMTKAVLVSGDRDFTPVVQSVAQAGTYVEVWFRKETGSKELAREADHVVHLDIQMFAALTKPCVRFPSCQSYGYGKDADAPVALDSSRLLPGASFAKQGEMQIGKALFHN